jgi:DNA gyrase subunit A
MNSKRKTPDLEALQAVLPGPDFPSGGILVDDGLAEAMATGRGSFRVRARASIVPITRSRQGIEVTELPFQVGPERVVQRIQDLVRDGKLSGIAAVNDYSDQKSGLRVVIECKSGVNPKRLLADLYRLTPLEESFGVNNVVLVGGVPTTLGIWELCTHYIAHRLEIIVNRTQHRLEKAAAALHLREGRLIALDAIDLVISIIRSSQDAPEARARLMEELSLSAIQAADILEMPLRRLTALARLELLAEIDALRKEIAGYEALLGSPAKQRKVLLAELKALVDELGQPRRTQILRPDQVESLVASGTTEPEEVGSDEPCLVALSVSGLIGREPMGGAKPAAFGRHDVIRSRVATTSLGEVAAITTRGRVVNASTLEISEVSGRSRGVQAIDVFGLDKGEQVLQLCSRTPAPDAAPLLLVTAEGVVKRVAASEVAEAKSGTPVIELKPGDRLVGAFEAPDGTEAILVSSAAQALRLACDSVSIQGKGAAGVAGMKLPDGAKVVGAGLVQGDAIVLTVGDNQTAKVTDAAEFPVKGRGTGGVRVTKFRDEKRIEWAYVGPEAYLVLIVGQADNPSKPDSSPEPLTIPHTARDLVSRQTSRRLLDIGSSRW